MAKPRGESLRKNPGVFLEPQSISAEDAYQVSSLQVPSNLSNFVGGSARAPRSRLTSPVTGIDSVCPRRDALRGSQPCLCGVPAQSARQNLRSRNAASWRPFASYKRASGGAVLPPTSVGTCRPLIGPQREDQHPAMGNTTGTCCCVSTYLLSGSTEDRSARARSRLRASEAETDTY